MTTTAEIQEPIRSTFPARLDRLGWSPSIPAWWPGSVPPGSWTGLQITIASSVTGVLSSPDALNMTSTEIGLVVSVYLR